MQTDPSTVGLSSPRGKRKKPADYDLANPPTVNLESLMAGTREAAESAYVEHVRLEWFTDITVSQLGLKEGYTPYLNIEEAVKSLPGYLQRPPWPFLWPPWPLRWRRTR